MDDSLSPSGLLFTPFCRSASKKAESSVEDCLKSTWLCSVVACLKKNPRYGVRAWLSGSACRVSYVVNERVRSVVSPRMHVAQ